MDRPNISVIIPVYNSGKYLRKCLDSVINQTYDNLEIILVDDGSTDGSENICDSYANVDHRIVCIHQPNQGVSRARNNGIKIATGDYIHFPDSDDYLELDTYEYLIKKMRECPCDIIAFEYYTTYNDWEKRHIQGAEKYGLCTREDAHNRINSGSPFSWNKLFSKDVICNVWFNEKIYRGEDSLFVHSALENAEQIYFDSRPLYHYVQSEESACRGKFRKNQLTALKLHDEYLKLYKSKYPSLWKIYISSELDLYISLYYDMYVDEENYTKEMKEVHSLCISRLKDNRNEMNFNGTKRIKYYLFCAFPKMYCRLHKKMHNNLD